MDKPKQSVLDITEYLDQLEPESYNVNRINSREVRTVIFKDNKRSSFLWKAIRGTYHPEKEDK